MIRKIKIKNFKSFDNFTLLLNNFNVLIGANSAGKTNFIDSLKFIYHSVTHDLTSAIRRRYGWEGIRCRKSTDSEIEFFIEGDFSFQHILKLPLNKVFKPKYFFFEFGFTKKERFKYQVYKEKLEVIGKEEEKGMSSKDGFSNFERIKEKVYVEESFALSKSKERKRDFPVHKHLEEKLFINARFMCFGAFLLSHYIENWHFYKLDPEAIRNPKIIEETEFVSEKGDTLALILNKLEKADKGRYKEIKERIIKIIKRLIPEFKNWTTRILPDGNITFLIKEKYTKQPLFPMQISDGTLHILALLTALLYYEAPPTLICIEEPERNIHPLLLEDLVDLMREISTKTQIIVTTHSPQLVRFCRPEEVVLVDKKEGITEMCRVDSVKDIDKFLENFTIDELWLHRYLEKGIPS